MKKSEDLEKQIGYVFEKKEYLSQALRHSSYINEHRLPRNDCNERLEFLGDAVLELVSSEYLFREYPQLPEGELTRFRASIVCEPTLAYCAREIELGEYLLLGKGEEKNGGKYRDSITSDALEALIGAIFLDGGMENAKTFILNFVLNDLEHKKLFSDSKTIFQEMVQGKIPGEISYQVMGESGPDHNKEFLVEVRIADQVMGSGSGKTKKAAEQVAAYHAICRLKTGNR